MLKMIHTKYTIKREKKEESCQKKNRNQYLIVLTNKKTWLFLLALFSFLLINFGKRCKINYDMFIKSIIFPSFISKY